MRRQELANPVPGNAYGVAAAEFHEAHGSRGPATDTVHKTEPQFGVTVFVDMLHFLPISREPVRE
jgi:hypothetical protein